MIPPKVDAADTFTSSKSASPSTSRFALISTLPPTFNNDPLNVRFELSCSSPPVPAMTMRLAVKSSTLNVFA